MLRNIKSAFPIVALLFIVTAFILAMNCWALAETGVASWYGPGFHGRRTASGERFNQNAMTCAHRSAPMGSRLRVTVVRTGRAIVCRVNDIGPARKTGRKIDLSRECARRLGIVSQGVALVRIERVR